MATTARRRGIVQLRLLVRDPKALKEELDKHGEHILKEKKYCCTDEEASVLHCAVLAENIESIELLLERKADINEVDKQGRTPLIRAVAEGLEEIAKLLVKYGADVNIVDKDGQNCCHWAFCMEHNALGEWLLRKTDVDRNCKDIEGRTPLDLRIIDDDLDEMSGPKFSSGRFLTDKLEIEEKDEDELDKKWQKVVHQDAKAFVINGEENNFAAGSGIRATRWLRHNPDGVMCIDDNEEEKS